MYTIKLSEIQTGGNCTAFHGLVLPSHDFAAFVLVTDCADASLPAADASKVSIGIYDSDRVRNLVGEQQEAGVTNGSAEECGKTAARLVVKALGDAFAEELMATIGPKFYSQVRSRNEKETLEGVCHSHDFCDANEVMLNALTRFNIGPEFDPADEHHCALWNAAWDYAATTHLGRRS